MVTIDNEALNEFINILRENKERELNFHALYQNLTLGIIGRTAFGIRHFGISISVMSF